MKPEFHEDRLGDNLDPVDAPDMGFDWEQLYRDVTEDAVSGENDPRLAQTVVRVLRLLLPNSKRRVQPESLGLKLIALAWVLSPAYFQGAPSIKRLARRCGIRPAAIANYTGYYSRLFSWRNRGQSHAWNWHRKGTPKHRGKGAPKKLKRNVPHSVERKHNRRAGQPDEPASQDERQARPTGSGVGSSTK